MHRTLPTVAPGINLDRRMIGLLCIVAPCCVEGNLAQPSRFPTRFNRAAWGNERPGEWRLDLIDDAKINEEASSYKPHTHGHTVPPNHAESFVSLRKKKNPHRLEGQLHSGPLLELLREWTRDRGQNSTDHQNPLYPFQVPSSEFSIVSLQYHPFIDCVVIIAVA